MSKLTEQLKKSFTHANNKEKHVMNEKEHEELIRWATERLKQTKTLEQELEDIRIELARLRQFIERED